MKTGILLGCIGLILAANGKPAPARAGVRDVGNGGDGIITPTGQVLLFDLFEMNAPNPDSRPVRNDEQENHLIDRMILSPYFRNDLEKTINSTTAGRAPKERAYKVRKILVQTLSEVARKNPLLAQLLISELKELYWSPSPTNLNPNVDTRPFIDLTGFTRVGCARNRSGTILVSPLCLSEKMSPGNFAGLIVHEAVYSLYRKRNRRSVDSFDVRAVVAQMFKDPANLGSVLERHGFKDVARDQENLAEVMQNTYFSGYFSCRFPDKSVLELSLLSGFAISGHLEYWGKDPASPQSRRQQILGFVPNGVLLDKAKGVKDAWLPFDLQYSLRERAIHLVLERGPTSLHLQILFHEDGRIWTKLSNGEQAIWTKDCKL